MKTGLAVVMLLAGMAAGRAMAGTPSPKEIVGNVLKHDFWGLSNAEIKASATIKDRAGATRQLMFEALSRQHRGTLTQSLVRFRNPPELAGAGFLQTQNDERDDDRFLYLPELKRSRRVAANQRSTSFMGTDFSFADIDRRDYRQGQVKSDADVTVGNHSCFQVTIVPDRKDSPYSKLELSVRKDNFIPLRIKMFDLSGMLIKTLSVFQLQRISGRWFITKSEMVNHKEKHSTVLMLTSIKPRDDIPADRFTVQNLER